MVKNLNQLQELMDGARKPDGPVEKIFMVGYNHALSNLELLDKYLELTGEIDYYEEMEQWHALILGYAMGQRRLNEEITAYDSNEDNQSH